MTLILEMVKGGTRVQYEPRMIGLWFRLFPDGSG
jgi:hypothetical protein